MKWFFHPLAEQELDKAVDYYEDCLAGLGLDFAREIHAAIHRIIQYPEAWSQISENTRRCLVSRFPFGIVYQIKTDVIVIIAVANLRRRPEYWQERRDS